MASTKSSEKGLDGFRKFNEPANPERIKEVAEKELGETEQRKEECLQKLRDLIKEHKVACITRDDFLLRFLRVKKFDVQRSFDSLRRYAKQRVSINERLEKLKPEVVEECLRRNVCGFLPYRDAEDRLIFVSGEDLWNPTICSEQDMTTFLLVMFNYAAEEPSSQTIGIVTISDRCLRLTYVASFLRNAKLFLTYLFNSLPIRYKWIHIVDPPFYFQYLLHLIRAFLPQKIKQRIVAHGKDTEVLFQHVSPNILPDVFSGNLGPLNNDHGIEAFVNHLQKMKFEQQYFLH